MKVNGVYIAGVGVSELEYIGTSLAVERGWYGAEERDRGGLLSIAVAGTTPAPDLAIAAAGPALARAGHPPAEFAAVFHTNVHPQGPHGWSAPHYINRNTINQPVTSVEVRNGCVGFFSGLELASCFLSAAPGWMAVLLTAADNFGTPSVDRWRASKLFVLGDGGGAVVLSKRGGFAKLLAIASVSGPHLEERHRCGESLFPPGLTAGRMLNFDQRSEYRRRKELAGLLVPLDDFGDVLLGTAEKALKEADTSMAEIAKVVHDSYTRPALHDLYLDPLGVEEERGIWELTRYTGHAGPVDQIRGLEYVWTNRMVGKGDKVLLISDAPGMEAACAVLEIIETP